MPLNCALPASLVSGQPPRTAADSSCIRREAIFTGMGNFSSAGKQWENCPDHGFAARA